MKFEMPEETVPGGRRRRRRRTILPGALWGGLTGLGVVGLSYFGSRLAGLPFVPLDVFDWLARVVPGKVINLTIEIMVRAISIFKLGPTWVVAKLAEQAMGVGLLVAAGIVFGAVLGGIARRARPGRLPVAGAAGGIVLLAVAAAAEFSVGFPAAGPVSSLLWLAVLLVGWGGFLGRILQAAAAPSPTETDVSRRRFLWLAGVGSFIVAVGALGVRVLGGKAGAIEAEAPSGGGVKFLELDETSGPAASPPWKELEARLSPAPGTRPELTPLPSFYRIDINTRPPEVDGASWRLEVSGLVRRPLSLSLEDLRSRPAVNQALTLSCISNPVGGDLISSGVWTGVRLKGVLAEAGLEPGAAAVVFRAADGFYESAALDEALDDRTLLVYAMDGEPLKPEHGFPLRVFIPGHYGMKQPKWITKLEAVDRLGAGYWVDRGWDRRAEPKTTSVVDAVAQGAGGGGAEVIPVGGIAYAGERGISKVEVQVDEGPWTVAELLKPPIGPLTWVQWRMDWKPVTGMHVFRVRAYDGRGVLQETEPASPYPAGAAGVHAFRAFVGPGTRAR